MDQMSLSVQGRVVHGPRSPKDAPGTENKAARRQNPAFPILVATLRWARSWGMQSSLPQRLAASLGMSFGSGPHTVTRTDQQGSKLPWSFRFACLWAI